MDVRPGRLVLIKAHVSYARNKCDTMQQFQQFPRVSRVSWVLRFLVAISATEPDRVGPRDEVLLVTTPALTRDYDESCLNSLILLKLKRMSVCSGTGRVASSLFPLLMKPSPSVFQIFGQTRS
jgi:hypothetical protein